MPAINVRIDVPDRFTPEEIFEMLDQVKEGANRAMPEIDDFSEMVAFSADWEDDEGTNYWSP